MNLNLTRLELYQFIQANEKINEASSESPITEIDADAVVAGKQSGKRDDAGKESTKVMLTNVQRSLCSIMY